MNCPNCGGEVTDDVPFCPHCGHNLEGRKHKRKLRFILMDVQDDRRFRHLASAAVITVVIVAVLSVLLALGGTGTTDDSPFSPTLGEPSSDAIIVSDTSYIELRGDFSNGSLNARLDSSGQMTIWLSGSASEGFSTYTWILRDENTNTAQEITKNAPSLVWVSPYLGTYTVTVVCSSDTGSDEVYVGTIEYLGDIHLQYSFPYNGENYTVYVDVALDEYADSVYSTSVPSSVRHSSDVASGARFIVVGDAVSSLSQRLLDAYTARNPSAPTDGPEYVNYILSFVQNCFKVGSDTYYHSTSTYWAFPAETLYTAVGDSGDLAVLTASLLIASGYDAGIATVNGHAFATVSLDRYTGPTEIPDGFHVLRVIHDGKYYYLCTVDEVSATAGCVSDAYGYSDDHFTYYGETASEGSGMAFP